MPNEPLTPVDAKKVILHIIKKGSVTYAQPHALDRMVERQITMPDCINVLRGGLPKPGEYENGSWRYRVCTPKMCVVINSSHSRNLKL